MAPLAQHTEGDFAIDFIVFHQQHMQWYLTRLDPL